MSKTVILHFCNNSTPHPEPNLTINKTQIPVLNEYTFGGVIFDKTLPFLPHMKYLKTKCQNTLNLLKVVSHMDNTKSKIEVMLGIFCTFPMESLYVEANEPSLYNRNEKLSLQYALKLK